MDNRRPQLKDKKKTISKLMKYIFNKHKMAWIVILICIIVSALTGVISTKFIQTLIDEHIEPLLSASQLGIAPNYSGLISALIYLGLVCLAGVLATLVQNLVMVVVSQRVLKKIRDDMFAKMQRMPIKMFDSHTHGDIMSRYTSDTDTLEQLITNTLPNVVTSLFTIIFTFVSMLLTSIYLTLVVLLTLVAMMWVTKKVGGKSGKHFALQQQWIGKVNGYVEEMMSGQKVVKVFNHETKSKEDFDKLNSELCHNSYTASKYANMFMPIMGNIGYVQYVLIAIVGGLFAITGVYNFTLTGFMPFSIGMISAFLLLSKSFSQPVTQLSSQINSVVLAMAGAERIFDFMDEDPEVDDGYVTLVNVKEENGKLIETDEHTHRWAWRHPHGDGRLTYTEVRGDVVMENVDFGYNSDKIVLHDVSLYARPGQKIAFVGSTGAGKTTITNLLNRFYDIADGKIRYDGININKIKKSDLRRAIGIVLQDTNLFTGTVRDNIRYGRLDATDEDILKAARLANADDFISRLPEGYDTMLTGNGENLSQGQRQLIAIARAAVADAPVMIMDEATSSIDTRTEKLVQEGTDLLMQGRTVFVIAHRLSTIHNADVIMVLENGVIIERGNHEQLMELKGKYYQLYTGKFELD
ncbi:MAG: ABC transporter ATP-binding protein [Clostridiales bacterium]|nr:ABC transporter ATP-binding protein [Clostridiales bacterium]